jgi:hypothetical protein
MAYTVPLVEVTYDADPLRVGRPDGELNPGHTLHRHGMRAQLLLQATMSPLLEQLYVCVRQAVPIPCRTFRRLWSWRGDYRVALDSPNSNSLSR